MEDGNVKYDIVVDGSNVARYGTWKTAVLENIRSMIAFLKKQGFRALIIVSAALRHRIDDPQGLEQLIQQGVIYQAPADVDEDEFILAFADHFNHA